MSIRIIIGDALTELRKLPGESVHCCVTSPPYYGLRDYGMAGQIGLEPSPDEYVAALVSVFREVRRVLRKDATLWLNIGDSYAGSGKGGNPEGSPWKGFVGNTAREAAATVPGSKTRTYGHKPKDLIGVPWLLAFALRSDGWYLRQDIIWSKPNPMPESVTDRCTKAHEYLFLLSRSERYYFDRDSIAEPFAAASLERLRQDVGKTNGPMKAVGLNANRASYKPGSASNMNEGEHVKKSDAGLPLNEAGRNKRSVWEVTTQPFSLAHFATFPPALIEPCIKACSSAGTCTICGAAWRILPPESALILDGIEVKPAKPARSWCGHDAPGGPPCSVLDPFAGAGTTGLVADRLGRNAILVELNPEYAAMARRRIEGDAPLFTEVA